MRIGVSITPGQADLFEDFFLNEDFLSHLSFLFLPHLRVGGSP
jgi:hypothetical protein